MRKRYLKLLSIGCLTCLALNVSGCSKKEVVEEPTKSLVDVLQEQTEESSESTLETDVEEIKETLPGGIEVSVDEEEKIDLIIRQLEEDVDKENIDIEHIDGLVEKEPETREQDIIDKENQDWENSVRESLGVETEPNDSEKETEVESNTETKYDVDNNPNTREVKGFEEETEPIIGEDGAIVETTERKIQKAKLEGSGPKIGENTSEKMRIGSVYNYFSDDGSKLGHVGDFVMCGQLAVNVVPGISEGGYTVSSSGNTATITTGYGKVLITKLNTDELQVSKMSAAQMSRLSGLNLDFVYMNGTEGNFGAYSQCMTDSMHKNGVQYYKCKFGTYEIKYLADHMELVFNLIMSVYPESSLNELATVN